MTAIGATLSSLRCNDFGRYRGHACRSFDDPRPVGRDPKSEVVTVAHAIVSAAMRPPSGWCSEIPRISGAAPPGHMVDQPALCQRAGLETQIGRNPPNQRRRTTPLRYQHAVKKKRITVRREAGLWRASMAAC